jgi:hypothetical protein
MAKIFLSYSRKDRELVLDVLEHLKVFGHSITVDVESVVPGQNFRKVLSDGLRNSEVFVVFLSENSMTSPPVLSEIGAARAYADESGELLVVPVMLDDSPIPMNLQDIYVMQGKDVPSQSIAEQINGAIASFEGKRAAELERVVAFSRRVEIESADYIDEAIQRLKLLESSNRRAGNLWYFAGFASLLGGLVFSVVGILNISPSVEKGWLELAVIVCKSLVILGLLGACSKYAYTLGKSYISESLKSADRMHAISFGKFYLKVYGDQATWAEVKDAFQHWNIDRASVFSNLGTSEFDPKLVESLVEVLKAVGGRGSAKN